jgi:DNA polymerase-3 subunit delta
MTTDPATDPAPAYLVKGDDPTLVGDAVRTLVAQLAGEDPGFAVEDLSGEDTDVGPVVDACSTPPFLADRRVVVVRDIGRFKAEEVAPLVDYLADPLLTTTLVVAAGGGQTPTRLLNAIKKVGHVVDAVPDQRARKAWMTDRIREASVKLDNKAADLVREHLGEDIARLGSLLDVLAAAYGEGARLGVDDVTPFLGEAGVVAPWDLTEAIDQGETERALTDLHRLMEAGDRHPLVIMATLHNHYAAMLRLDGAGVRGEAEAAKLLGIHPFRAGKALAQGRRLGSANIARAIELLATADLDLRGMKQWPDELVLEVLVARLCRLVPPAARSGAGSGGGRSKAGSGRR